MDQTKRCPLCGETILTVAVRCRFCQGDLSARLGEPHEQPANEVVLVPAPAADKPARLPAAPPPTTDEEFEQRFLEFAYTTDYVINAPAVAYALKVPIDDALNHLEDLAARDVLIREVDARGSLFFYLPGRNQMRPPAPPGPAGVTFTAAAYAPPSQALSPYAPQALDTQAQLAAAPSEGTALAGLLVNTLCLPGLGSIIGGRTATGIGQMLLFLVGCISLILIVGAPMILSAWIWGLVTGIDVMNQAKLAQAQRRAQLGPPTL